MLKNKVPFIFFIAAFQLLILSSVFAQVPKQIKTIIVDAGHGGHDGGAHGGYEGGLNSQEKNVTLAISLKLVESLKKAFPGVKIVPTRTTDIYQSPSEKANIANENKGDLFICIHADALALKTGRRQIGTREEVRHKVTYTGKGKKRKKNVSTYTVTVPVYQYYKIGSQRSGTSVWLFAQHKTSEKIAAIMKDDGLFDIGAGADSALNAIDFSTPERRIIATLYQQKYQLKSDMLAQLVNDEVEKTGRNALGVNQRQVGIWVLQATKMPAILVETGFITNYEDERYLNSSKGQQEIADAITNAVRKYKEQVENPKGIVATPANNNAAATLVAPTATNDDKPAYEQRKQNVLKTIEAKQNTIAVDLYDDGDIDGDIVSVYFNGKNILNKQKLTDQPTKITLTIDPSLPKNELTIFAENEGDIPPNTGLMIVNSGGIRHEVRFKADSNSNGVIIFTHK